jgi:hypothetical protein
MSLGGISLLWHSQFHRKGEPVVIWSSCHYVRLVCRNAIDPVDATFATIE